MPSDSGDRRTATAKPTHHQGGGGGGGGVGAPPPEPEHLPCPRCESTNTKFCYYNNYNFSQPRHFCKACRRYWTHGGTLRDIPVGGGSRKNAKRSRVNAPQNNSAVSSPLEYRHMQPPTASPFLIPFEHGGSVQFLGDGKPVGSLCGSFTSLLNSPQGPGLFGIGVGGFEDVSFGLGRQVWPFSGIVDGGIPNNATAGGGGGASGSMIGGGNTWQLESGEVGGFIGGGDCFPFPDLAISTPGNGMK